MIIYLDLVWVGDVDDSSRGEFGRVCQAGYHDLLAGRCSMGYFCSCCSQFLMVMRGPVTNHKRKRWWYDPMPTQMSTWKVLVGGAMVLIVRRLSR